MLPLILIVAGVLFLHIGYCVGKRARRYHRALVRWILFIAVGLMAAVGVPTLAAGMGLLWYTHRPRPESDHRILFDGITYTRDVRSDPRPVIIHVIAVDLSTPGLRFLVTPGEPTQGKQMRARTTSQFLSEFDVQVAVNGDCFDEWHGDGLWNPGPRTGEPLNVLGNAASRGDIYSQGKRTDLTLYISRENKARFGKPIGEVYNAISGTHLILKGGRIARNLPTPAHPRTAVALDHRAATLLFFVVDGRQPNYSEGLSLEELARLILEYGGETALNFDGGGSSALAIEGKNGRPLQLNSPIHTRIPGRERPVANHLGICVPRRKPGH